MFAASESELEALLYIVETFSSDIGMEFGIEKCAALQIIRGRKVSIEGIDLPNGMMMREVEEIGYKYLGVLEGADIKKQRNEGKS